MTYAAVAPKASNGFEAIGNDNMSKKANTKTVITANLACRVFIAWRIQMGVMSIITPTATITPEANPSIRLSE